VGERSGHLAVTPPAPLAESVATAPDPLDAYARVSHLPYPILLDSAERGPRGRYSFVAADPVAVVRRNGDATALDAAVALAGGITAAPIAGLPPFQGGIAGYIGYEWGATLERLPPLAPDDLGLPEVLLSVYDWVLAWDHQQGTAWIISRGLGGRDPARRIAEVRDLLAAPPRGRATPAADIRGTLQTFPVVALEPLRVRSPFERPAYEAAVERVRQYILAGDVFQVNISQRFEVPVTGTPLELYRRLRSRHPAGFAALMETDEFAVLSASPERFFRVDGATVEARPIKGTRPRGAPKAEDRALATELELSAKDRAENVMIVDLMRNDLYRVSVPGSVRVPELCVLESHPTVHHLVSTIESELSAEDDAVTLLRAAFPGGSITGAPKVRAMEIIAELEPTRRGVYCGSIGYLSVTGAADFSIAIRTAVVRGGTAYVGAGGGVTADSDPAAEYDETVAKARGVLAALAGR
jgi:para-aminobenzoate synthetase component I